MLPILHYFPDQINQVFYEARDGKADTLCALLETIDRNKLQDLLSQEVCDDFGQKCTPFIIAARNGHNKVIKMFLNNEFPVNLEQEGSVIIGNSLVEGASALWCAAGAGHLQVVKALVNAGANVNHATSIQSTLQTTCFDENFDITQYLTGADLNKSNFSNNSCLMIATYGGFLDIVSYLLQNGADPNHKTLCGNTAMHFAARFDYSAIVKKLLVYDAKMTRNKHGLTPLLIAAQEAKPRVVTILLTKVKLTWNDKIDALELLGASFANNRYFYNHLDFAFKLIKKAMEIRYRFPGKIIYKPECEPIEAYNYKKECQNLEELEIIRRSMDVNELQIESLVMRQRILGQHNPNIIKDIVFRGDIFAGNLDFDRCILLWLHAMNLCQLNRISIAKILHRISKVFSRMVLLNETIKFTYFKKILSISITELRLIKELLRFANAEIDINELKDEMQCELLSVLYLIVIIVRLENQFTSQEKYELNKLVYELVKIKATTKRGKTLLHLCVDSKMPFVTVASIADVCSFPCLRTTKLLLKCGADVNAMDDFRNTPLHLLVDYKRPLSFNDNMTLYLMIRKLIKAGAHNDIANTDNKTPFEVANSAEAEEYLLNETDLKLKCISAKAVQKHKIPYIGQVPKELESFITLHGVG